MRGAIAVVLTALVASCGGERDDSVEVAGTIEADRVQIGAPLQAQVLEMRVDEGDVVVAGQVLAVLDQPSVTGQVPVLRAQLDAARARLRELEAGARPEEVQQARAAVEQARAQLEQADRDVARAAQLVERQVVGRAELERAETLRAVTAQTLAQAEERLRLAEQGVRAETIEAQRAQVAAAEAAVAAAELTAALLVVTTPIDGVVQLRAVEPGATVGPGSPLYRIAQTSRPYMRAYLPEPYMGRVRPGSIAEVRVNAYPERVFHGEVQRVASEAEFTPRVAQTEAQRADLVFELRIALEDAGDLLLPGMPAYAVIRLDESPPVSGADPESPAADLQSGLRSEVVPLDDSPPDDGEDAEAP